MAHNPPPTDPLTVTTAAFDASFHLPDDISNNRLHDLQICYCFL